MPVHSQFIDDGRQGLARPLAPFEQLGIVLIVKIHFDGMGALLSLRQFRTASLVPALVLRLGIIFHRSFVSTDGISAILGGGFVAHITYTCSPNAIQNPNVSGMTCRIPAKGLPSSLPCRLWFKQGGSAAVSAARLVLKFQFLLSAYTVVENLLYVGQGKEFLPAHLCWNEISGFRPRP